MSETNNTTKTNIKQYHHLTYKDRCAIQTLANQRDKNGKRMFNNSYIARYLNVNRSTISRELNNRKEYRFMVRSGKTYEKPYNASYAQNNYKFKRGLSKGIYKLRKYKIMADFIEKKIKIDKWAPDVIVGYMKEHGYFNRNGFTSITTPTIYNAIRYGIINIKLEDTRRMKEETKYKYHKDTSLPSNKIPYSIESRPEEINERTTFGHFEIDTVIGTSRGKHECLLTMTERKTRYEMIFKITSKSAIEVNNKIIQIKKYINKYFYKIFKSFSTDNGTEFSGLIKLLSNSKTSVYYCHPYCSGEKGTNEKHNSIIRYFIPKKTLIENYSYEDINNIANWMNNYPRKILNYKTPLEALLEEFNDKNIINKFYKLQQSVNIL